LSEALLIPSTVEEEINMFLFFKKTVEANLENCSTILKSKL